MSKPAVSVIVPTYREGKNLIHLVPRIYQALGSASIEHEILIVDDDSQDDTETTCQDMASRYPLRLEVRRGERGLASAVVRGMQLAKGEVLVVMDGDLSHPPERIPDLITTLLNTNAEMVLGSRYIAGGSTEEGWGLLRKLNSKVAVVLARPLTSVRDPMAGFFAIRRTVVTRADRLDPIGYKIGLELIVKCRCTNVLEVPIDFRNRRFGTSKMTIREQIDYLHHVTELYYFKYGWRARVASFAAVGASGMVVDLGSFAALLPFLRMGPARAFAIWLAMTWNFFLNRQFTFSDLPRRGLLRQYVGFCVGCLAGAVVNWSVSMFLCRALNLSAHHSFVAAFCGVVAGMLLNFSFCLKCVFTRDDSGNERSSLVAASSRSLQHG